jgi:NADH:ubiquinone oxidoreductase subunit 2 (subunit N)
MAYSSIGHVGYALAGVAVLGGDFALAAKAVVFYLVVYAATNLLVFAGLTACYNRTGQDNIADLAGLADRQPFVAAAIAIGLFSLAGLPIFAGFTAKFYLFAAVADGGFLWLAGVAIFGSLISLYYYLQVLRQMYIEPAPRPGREDDEHEPDGDHAEAHGHDHREEPPVTPMPRPSLILTATIGAGLLVVTWLGIYPAPLLGLIDAASAAIVPLG